MADDWFPFLHRQDSLWLAVPSFVAELQNSSAPRVRVEEKTRWWHSAAILAGNS